MRHTIRPNTDGFQPTLRHFFVVSLFVLVAFGGTLASAQTTALSAGDRQALLYAPQLSFARNGEPIIRLGIDETKKEYTFIPTTNIFVLPSGKGGPKIELPKGEPYTVRILNGQPGKYTHSVTVERIPTSQQSQVEDAIARWKARGFSPETTEVGGLFSISGNVFDSRLILINVEKTDSYKQAIAEKRKLEDRYGVVASVNSQLSRFPDGVIELSSPKLQIKIETKKVLSVVGADDKGDDDASGDGKSPETVFAIPNLKSSHEKVPRTKRFVGELVFAPGRRGDLVVMVNTPAERVLKGTVPSETFPKAPAAALQAQAVAARNNLISSIGVRNLADPYMMRTDVMDQVYNGIDAETPVTNQAVDATRGKVMMWKKRIINAVYSSNAAGYSVDNEDAWDMAPVPWLRGKPDLFNNGGDPFPGRGPATDDAVRAFLENRNGWGARANVASSRYYRWHATVPLSVVQESLKRLGVNIGTVVAISRMTRGKTGRVKVLTLKGTRGTYTIEGELNIRRLFGGLKSALFLVSPLYRAGDTGNTLTGFDFDGGGFGHGVGMCQTGAIARAEAGQSATDILKHYFTGVSIQTLY